MTTPILKFDATSATIVKRQVSKTISSMKKSGQQAKLRKSARPLPPDTVERYYRRLLKDYLNALDRITAKIIMPEVESILKEADKKRPTITQDASYSDDIARMIREAKLKINEEFSAKELSNMARRVAARGDTFNKEQVSKVFKKILGLDPIATEPWLKQEVKAFVKVNAGLIKSISTTYLSQVEQVVSSGARSGYTTKEIADEIEKRFNVSESKAAFLARDQVSKFNGDLTKLRYQNVGVNRYEWSTSGDERVRDSHVEKDGNIYSFDDPPSDTGNPGDDYQCVPYFQSVKLHAPTKKAFRRWYDGELTKIVSDFSEPLLTTPNHPVLTQRGWIAAQFIEVGDYLIQAPNESVNGFIQNPKSGNSNAHEMFSSFKKFGLSHRVSGVASWFHGDSVNKHIDVVNINRSLFRNNKASLSKGFGENVLAFTSKPSSSKSQFPLNNIADNSSSNGIMGCLGKSHSFDTGSMSHSIEHGSTFVSYGNLALNEYSSDWRSTQIELLSDSFLAHSVKIHPNNFIFRKVKSIGRESFKGFVHNFETVTGWFSSSNLIIHNCRCVAIPVFDEEE